MSYAPHCPLTVNGQYPTDPAAWAGTMAESPGAATRAVLVPFTVTELDLSGNARPVADPNDLMNGRPPRAVLEIPVGPEPIRLPAAPEGMFPAPRFLRLVNTTPHALRFGGVGPGKEPAQRDCPAAIGPGHARTFNLFSTGCKSSDMQVFAVSPGTLRIEWHS